ncbi:unnamed protein product [Acidithrix sp. C25]|nr:unnamed protein product [Acidithrix sp. C25]
MRLFVVRDYRACFVTFLIIRMILAKQIIRTLLALIHRFKTTPSL